MPKCNVEVRHLRFVVTAAEEGSFRRASTKLGVRESTISRQIRDLEDAVGSSLFVRRRSGVFLTQAGENFVRRAQCALTQIEYAIRDIGVIGRGGSGVIRIGVDMLERGDRSAWHRVDSAEVWHWYAGAPLELRIGKGSLALGNELGAGQRPQGVVPRGEWQSAQSLGDWTLVGCTVAPGFEFAHFEMAPKGFAP